MRPLRLSSVPPPYHRSACKGVRKRVEGGICLCVKGAWIGISDSARNQGRTHLVITGYPKQGSLAWRPQLCDTDHISLCPNPSAPGQLVLKMKCMKKEIAPVSGRPLLSVQQVCDYLTITKSTFYKWRAKGLGPRVIRLLNGDLRISEEALSTFVLSLLETPIR